MKPSPGADPKRSALMARVRQRGTNAELVVAAILRGMRVAYRLNVRSLPGSPDFANKTRGWAIFVHGCFWHRHEGCKRTTTPKNNRDFWLDKFKANKARDERAVRKLRDSGYRVAVVWECETADLMTVRDRVSEILESGGIDRS